MKCTTESVYHHLKDKNSILPFTFVRYVSPFVFFILYKTKIIGLCEQIHDIMKPPYCTLPLAYRIIELSPEEMSLSSMRLPKHVRL